MHLADETLHRRARDLKAELLARMFGRASTAQDPAVESLSWPATSNLVGVGYGAKVAVGRPTDELAVRVYVRTKLSRRRLTAAELVPEEVAGVATDVLAVGDLAFRRPVSCGVSVGHRDIAAGTLGCLVTRDGSDERLILSNNHVLANANAGAIGDPILEPGPADGGDPADPIAELTDFEPIDFEGSNVIDAAVARLLEPSDVTPDIGDLGQVDPNPLVPSLYASVRKHGRTTQHTVGVVMGLSEDLNVRFGQLTMRFVDQLAVVGAGTAFSDGGDSGSLVVDGVSRRPVGLLFAGGGDHTFANPIEPILARFGATIVSA